MSGSTTRDDSRIPDFSVLRISAALILVPRGEVRLLELAIDMDADTPPSGGVGWITVGNERIPVYCWTDDLVPTQSVPKGRAICAVLAGPTGDFGLLCDEVALVPTKGLTVSEVPLAMRLPGLPFDRLAVIGEGVAMVSTAGLIHADLLTDHSA